MSPTNNRVIVFDTTLRDGEQSPGGSMNIAQKTQIASALADLGVDVIELGFPVASPGDFTAVETIANKIEGPILCALARAHRPDIDRTRDALRGAKKKRIHVFLATSPLHREYKLQMNKEQVLARAKEAVAHARTLFDDVQFSAEDAARTEPEFLSEVIEAVIAAGATTVNIPDTVGYAVPSQYAGIMAHLKRTVRNIDKAVISVHCHDDLGLAVANSLAALMEGARQIECTINGIGERAGNASLEEVVMALAARRDFFGLDNGIKTERLYPTSRLVSKVTGLLVQRNKAIVGQNAFAHEAGIHQHGVLKNAATYEIMKPEDVGVHKSTLVLGKHSGRHLLCHRVRELGYQLDDKALDRLFDEFKALCDKKKDVYDADLEALVRGQVDPDRPALWTLSAMSVSAGSGGVPCASLLLAHRDGRKIRDAACGDGPVDAIFKTAERITGINVHLTEYRVEAVSDGEDAQGQVTVEVEASLGGRRFKASAASTDIIEASALAFLDALNRVADAMERRERRTSIQDHDAAQAVVSVGP